MMADNAWLNLLTSKLQTSSPKSYYEKRVKL